MSDADTRRAIEAIWHLEAARVIGRAARLVRDVGLAEDLAQDALVAALETWPRDGVPANPAAWLMTATRHRALDHLRHAALAAGKAALTAAKNCQQVLAGIGFTAEHDFHHHMKRVLVLDGLLGSSRELTKNAGGGLRARGSAPRLAQL